MSKDADQRGAWDEVMAHDLPGKLLLVGLTFTDIGGKPERQEQFWGRVTSVAQDAGITLALQGSRDGESFNLPPDMRSIESAPPGEYHLRSTGEVVTNPDYTITFFIQPGER
ncbi:MULTISPECIES: hypothetical protein [unclassified Dyella]|jgi:hypothetical protein|uniref:hypothetical protein n=1 Tax=unclassified Dyella TaxID=2634549 RepID=UPI002D3013EC|nr:hypothetical protein [Terriglobales bacterium]